VTVFLDELHLAGFEVVWHETTLPMNENDIGDFRAKCYLKKMIPEGIL